MPSRDAISGVKVVASVGAEALSADKDGDTVDGRGFEEVLHVVEIGVGGITFSTTNKIELELEASPDNSVWTDVTGVTETVINTASSVGVVVNAGTGGLWASITAATHDDMSYAISYVGKQRYSRVVINFSGTHGTATPISASAMLMRAAQQPVL